MINKNIESKIYVQNKSVTEAHLFVIRKKHHKNIKLHQQRKHVLCIKRRKQDIFIGYF